MTVDMAKYANMIILFVALIILLSIIDFVTRKIIRKVSSQLAEKSKTHFDDILIKNKAPRNLAHVIPLTIALELMPYVFVDFPYATRIVEKTLLVGGIIIILWIVRSLLNTLKDYFKTRPRLKDKPIDSFIQVFMIFAWIAGFMFAFVIITETSIWKFVTAFGAISAATIFVFKDSILGFVASIQVAINDMVRIEDWISFDKYGADGYVIEINLATVKVQNFDKTITTIPTYALISDSFKNWRGMEESGGRRIKRSIIIKQGSVKFLTPEDISKLNGIQLISPYLKDRVSDIESYNLENGVDKSLAINGRNLTNLGVFRKYVESYLENHSAINKDMMIMARQLDPTPQGIPVQIYAFSSDKRWENYEYIMADIFDHLIASISSFDLELYELPDSTVFGKFDS